jgi:hypothetical protein
VSLPCVGPLIGSVALEPGFITGTVSSRYTIEWSRQFGAGGLQIDGISASNCLDPRLHHLLMHKYNILVINDLLLKFPDWNELC